jgi:hypothetical protein
LQEKPQKGKVKLPYKAKENEKNDHLQKEADSLY